MTEQFFDDSSWNEGKPRPRISTPTPLNEISFNATSTLINLFPLPQEDEEDEDAQEKDRQEEKG